jgi:hypothetical protein
LQAGLFGGQDVLHTRMFHKPTVSKAGMFAKRKCSVVQNMRQ